MRVIWRALEDSNLWPSV